MKLNVLTYNIHSCRGRDGQYDPDRIVSVIRSADADVVALQEVDVHRPRSRGVNQAEYIAAELGMRSCFYATVQQGDEEYGGAILSRYPMRLVKMAALPGPGHLEPRGAVWARIHLGACELNVMATHLGLRARERRLQVDALLGNEWLNHWAFSGPSILCGDFNLFPWSSLCRRLAQRLHDARKLARESFRHGTFLGMFAIDHIFFSDELSLNRLSVVRDKIAWAASDHLPLRAELRLDGSLRSNAKQPMKPCAEDVRG